jgi:thiamine biosynthesis protein ThiI
MFDTVVIRSGELSLKGGNRIYFEKRLMENIKRRTAALGDFKFVRTQGNILLRAAAPMTPEQTERLTAILKTTFGVANFSFAAWCEKDLDAIGRLAAQVFNGRPNVTFKVESRREDKTYPLTSLQISDEIGGRVLEAVPGLRVDVHNPDITINVSLLHDGARVTADQIAGHAGLPTGVSGKVVVLLSGGIDSPVAAWKLMRRGCQAVFVHCHSYPYVNDASIDKVKRLAKSLAEYQGPTTLYTAPIADAQREIVAKCDESLRVVLYRRLMMRVASAIAEKEGALAVVTGDSVGQVASQTLENLRTVTPACSLPVFRPLIGENKDDIVDVARRIGTLKTSIERQDDCCSLFMPEHPATRATVAQAEAEEAKFEAGRLVAEAVQKSEKIVIES